MIERMATTERDYYELLGVSAHRRRRRDQEGVPPARARAPSGRLRRSRTRRSASARSSRPTRCSPSSETRELYDRYGHAGLRSGGFTPASFDFGNLSDLFSAFFGDDLFGVAAGRRRARGADVARRGRDRARRGRDAASKREVPFPVAVACATCDGSGAEPGTEPVDLPDLRRRAAACSSVSRSVVRRVRPHADLPALRRRAAGSSSTPARDCDGAGPAARGAHARGRDPRGHPRRPADPDLRRGPRRRARRAGGRRLRPASHVRPDPRFVREGNDIFSTVDLTMTAGGARRDGVRCRRSTATSSSSFEPGTQPGEIRVLRGRGMPVLQGFGRGDQRVLVNVSVPRRLTRRAARAARGVRRRPATRTPTEPTRASSTS